MKSTLSTLLMGLIAIILFSCSNDPIKVNDPKKETTVQIQQLAMTDSIYYKVVEINDDIYIVKDGLVVKKVVNESGTVSTLFLVILVMIMLINVGIAVIKD